MQKSIARWGLFLVAGLMTLVGMAGLVLAAMLAVPPKTPPELVSIGVRARALDRSNLPPVQRFQARDGTELAYRAYEPPDGTADRVAILIHGSSGNGTVLNVMARALAEAGVAAVAPDMRGHGGSGSRGDIAYLGQLDDDLEDLVAHLRRTYLKQPIMLAGHSAGGGFTLRIAAGARAHLFERYVLLAPYLGPFSPTARPDEPSAHWADAAVPRILALNLLSDLGITCCGHLNALAFAAAPNARLWQTVRYSYLLMRNFAVPSLRGSPFAGVQKPVGIIVGAQDELLFAERYREVAPANVPVVIVNSDHMGLLAEPAAIAELIKVVRQ